MVSRFECLRFLARVIEDALVVMWGSGARSEWYHLRPYPPSLDTAMGYASPLGIGLALALPHRRVVVIDTDGGLLLNLGVLATLGNLVPLNLKVFVVDNECYESVGALPTATAGKTDLAAMARGAGIENVMKASTLREFKSTAKRALADNNLHFIVAKVERGTKKLPPLFGDGIQRKYEFVRYIEEIEKIHVVSSPLQQMPEHLLK